MSCGAKTRRLLFSVIWLLCGVQGAQSQELASSGGPLARSDAASASVEKLIDLGRLQEARAKLRAQIAREGERPRLLLCEAMILYREQQYADSIRVLERILNLPQADADAYKLLGLNLVSAGRPDLAGAYFEKAAEIAPRDFMAWYYLSLHELTGKQFDRAEAHAQRVLELQPKYLDAYLVLGVAQEQQNRELDAIRTYRGAIEIAEREQAKTEMPYLYLARLLISRREFGESRPLLAKAVALNPKSPEARTLLGQVQSRFEQYDQAIETLLEAARLAPHEKSPHYILMGIYQKLGRKEEALREMRMFRALEEKEIHK